MSIIILAVLMTISTVGKVSADSLFGDVVGKVTAGYQGYFAAQGDNSPLK